MYTWWECFQGNRQLFILAIYDESKKMIGIAPLHINKKRLGGIPVLKYIKFFGTLPISSDHLVFIISKGAERKVLWAIIEYLFQENRWDYSLLTNIPATSLTGRPLKEILWEADLFSQKYLRLPL